jgi:integration host factor subunit beta
MQTMTRSRLITELAREHQDLNEDTWEKIVGIIFEEITSALAQNRRVELRGFGAFTTRMRPARTGRNPRTGESVKVSDKWTPYFRAGKKLRERVNEPVSPNGKKAAA